MGEERPEVLVLIWESPGEGARKVAAQLESLHLAFERWPEVQLEWAAWPGSVRSCLSEG